MEDLRRYFSSESIEKLKNLNEDLLKTEAFSDALRLKLFRALHTVKGSSQTFGFASAGVLAHRLENLLSNARDAETFNGKVKNLFVEGIELLIECLREKHFKVPASFVEKIETIASYSVGKSSHSEILLPEIPSEISAQLSNQEKNALAAALGAGKNIYGLEVGFDSADFAAPFKNLREILSEACEIIATLPGSKFMVSGEIGFQIILASDLETAQIKKTAEKNAARMILDTSDTIFSNDLQGVLSQVVEHGKKIAEKLGKKVEFAVSADAPKLSARRLKLIFDVLVHLTRNAVDHAVESEGKIEIDFKVEENNLRLSVSDDGRGIDSEKIKRMAIEKNLISADRHLNGRQALDLIFLPEFSTASRLTEISGRGIGLDAVKTAVEAAGGEINVESRSGKGTTFEIFLPK